MEIIDEKDDLIQAQKERDEDKAREEEEDEELVEAGALYFLGA